MTSRMYVLKRGEYHGVGKHVVLKVFNVPSNFDHVCLGSDGRKEYVMFDKITSRVSKLCYGLNQDFVDPVC